MEFNGKSFHEVADVHTKECVVCKNTFVPTSGVNKFCSTPCKGRWKYITGSVSTGSQYKEISGNWKRYLSRLIYVGGRKRDGLNRDQLLILLKEQDYTCAISGIKMTCELKKGVKFPHNVSIDRIEAGGSYSIENIQLVCRCINSWRSDTDLDTFIDVCKKITKYQGG